MPEWDALSVTWTFDYEVYTATTEDGWKLKFFRITSYGGVDSTLSTKPPVFFQHGSSMDATVWMGAY